MTKTEYNQLLSQLPESLRKEYGFNKPFDYSPYKCIHTDEYDYYPELDCCIIDEIPVVWEKATDQFINLKNPEHLAELKKRVVNRKRTTHYIVSLGTDSKRIAVQGQKNTKQFQEFVKEKHFISITYHEITMYYNPNNIDLTYNTEMRLLAWCIIVGKKYNPIGIDPEPNKKPSEWMALDF